MKESPFSDSLIRNPVETLFEVRQQATAHIEAEEVVLRKNGRSQSKQPRHKKNGRDCSHRKNEASIAKRTDLRYVPYVSKKDKPEMKVKGETTILRIT